MSADDVYPTEMNEPDDFDDAAADGLLSGDSGALPQLADFVGDVRVAYTSTPVAGAEIAALMGLSPPMPAPSFVSRRFERMRSSMLAKIGAATAVVAAATGGLAAAHALPAPVENAVSHLGIGASSHDSHEPPSVEDSTTSTTVDSTATTMPTDTTPTTAERSDNHGGEVSAVAHDHGSEGCEHGAAVSNVASDGRSGSDSDEASGTGSEDAAENESQSGSCETTTTLGDGGIAATTDNNEGDTHQSDDNHDGTSPTTVPGGTTPTSELRDGGGDHGSSNGGDANSSGNDHGGTSGSGRGG